MQVCSRQVKDVGQPENTGETLIRLIQLLAQEALFGNTRVNWIELR